MKLSHSSKGASPFIPILFTCKHCFNMYITKTVSSIAFCVLIISLWIVVYIVYTEHWTFFFFNDSFPVEPRLSWSGFKLRRLPAFVSWTLGLRGPPRLATKQSFWHLIYWLSNVLQGFLGIPDAPIGGPWGQNYFHSTVMYPFHSHSPVHCSSIREHMIHDVTYMCRKSWNLSSMKWVIKKPWRNAK